MRFAIAAVLALLLIRAHCSDAARENTPQPTAARSSTASCGKLARIDAYVEAYRQMAVFDGVVLIAENDNLVYHCGYGLADYRFGTPMSTDAKFRIASLSKQFTQAAIGRLVDAGTLALDAPLQKYLPGYPEGQRITVRQLIEHTSGVAHTNRLDWMDMREALSLEQIVSRLRDEPLAFDPGTDNAYSNGGYALLAAIIEAASQQSFARFVETEIASAGYPSVGHESPYAVVPGLVSRYAPGPVYGERVEAPTYLVANRIGGGSLYANAEDVWRFFRASYLGEVLSDSTTAELLTLPSDGDVLITGRAPGALAQIYMNFDTGLSVVTLSSNSGWPGSFNSDIVALYRGEDVGLTPFVVDETPLTEASATPFVGSFVAERFGWQVKITRWGDGLAFIQDNLPTAFARTQAGAFHLPIYDWLCDYDRGGASFTCRQRDPSADIRFVFNKVR